jgi:hypothetical protein
MNTGLFMLLFASPAVGQECEDLKRDMKALEIFLQDQDDHAQHCPKLDWEQPDISVYKKKLKSQLPKDCKD